MVPIALDMGVGPLFMAIQDESPATKVVISNILNRTVLTCEIMATKLHGESCLTERDLQKSIPRELSKLQKSGSYI